jgi:hypothetical protein
MAIIRLARSLVNSIAGVVSYGIPAVVNKSNEPIRFYIGDRDDTPQLINNPPFSKLLSYTFPTTFNIANGTSYNILTNLTTTDIVAGEELNLDEVVSKFSFNDTNKSILFPPFLFYCEYKIRINLVGTFSGGANADRQFSVELRRGLDDSLIADFFHVKIRGSTLDFATSVFFTFTRNPTDPFIDINSGLKLTINNGSGATIRLDGFQVVIFGTATNFKQ